MWRGDLREPGKKFKARESRELAVSLNPFPTLYTNQLADGENLRGLRYLSTTFAQVTS